MWDPGPSATISSSRASSLSRREITEDDIESLAVGAWVLGTGGGGNPYLSLLNMRALYREGQRVQLIDAGDLVDDAYVAVIANMGAPLVGIERLTDHRVFARAAVLMEEHTRRRFDAVMGMEIGGGNGVRPLMVAAHLGMPVVDSDTMGRAYPEAQMTSVAVGGLKPCPMTVVDVRGLEAVVETVPTWKWAERVGRKICVEYGLTASTCQPPRTGAEVKRWGIHGTTTKAIAIGHAVREAQRTHDDPVAAILAVEPGKLLYAARWSTSNDAPQRVSCVASCVSRAWTTGAVRQCRSTSRTNGSWRNATASRSP